MRHEDVKDAPEKLAAQGALTRILLEQRVDLYRRHLDESESWSDEWHSAGFESEYLPRLNASELAELQAELDTLIHKYQARGKGRRGGGRHPGSRERRRPRVRLPLPRLSPGEDELP